AAGAFRLVAGSFDRDGRQHRRSGLVLSPRRLGYEHAGSGNQERCDSIASPRHSKSPTSINKDEQLTQLYSETHACQWRALPAKVAKQSQESENPMVVAAGVR